MSFKALRERWLEYLGQSRRRSIVLIDEAQECSPAVLNELRLMSSHCFDSQMLSCIVLASDDRLPEKMRRDDLLPLGSRIRIRLALEPQTPEELRAYLDHMLEAMSRTPSLIGIRTISSRSLRSARYASV